MGIIYELKSRNDKLTMKELNEFLRFSVRLAEAKMKHDFLRTCIDKNEFPKFYWKILRRNHIHPTSKTLKRHTLNLIDASSARLCELERNVEQRKPILFELDSHDCASFLSYTEEVCRKRCETLNTKLKHCLNAVKPQMKFPDHPERYVSNYSSVSLSSIQLEALSLGPKFSLRRTKVNKLDTQIQFENLINQTKDLLPSADSEADHFKSTVLDCCQQYLLANSSPQGLLTKQHIHSIKQLRNNKDLIISKPDKGAGIVLMDKSDYITKMNNLLNDPTKFSLNNNEKDKTDTIESDLCELLKKMKDNSIISTDLYERLKPTGSTIPRLYGLPKIHKPDIPLRPILDMSNSPYHTLAQWIAKLLEPIRKRMAQHSLKDSFEFVEKIKDIDISGKSLFSFDVVSLFTNVPLTETISYLCDYIDCNNLEVGIPTNYLKEILLRCTFNIQFTFDTHIYRQTDGVAMGSPLGPLLADCFMSKLENGILKETFN